MEDWDGRPEEGADDDAVAATPDSTSSAGPEAAPEPVGPYSFRPSEPDAAWSPPPTSPSQSSPLAPAPADPTGAPQPAPTPSGDTTTPMPATAPGAPTAMSRVAEELVAWFKTLVSAAVYATLIVTFGFQVARVEGESMAPTLQNQDRLIVNKLAYRLADPQLDDIVMLYYPLDPDKSFVKRVVAEAGDSIRSTAGLVYRNEVPLPDDFIPEEYRSKDTWGPRTVPDGYYFVMGDHRSNSSDSRTWDYVPKKYIIGKVQLRWWPVDHARWF